MRRSMQIMNVSIFCGLDIHRNGLSYATIIDHMGKGTRWFSFRFPWTLQADKDSDGGFHRSYSNLQRVHKSRIPFPRFAPNEKKVDCWTEDKDWPHRPSCSGWTINIECLTIFVHAGEEISSLREMVRRRVYLVRERTKLRIKIRDCLALSTRH